MGKDSSYCCFNTSIWNNFEVAYEALIGGVVPEGGEVTTVANAVTTIRRRYGQQPPETDEFLKPIVFEKKARIQGLQC